MTALLHEWLSPQGIIAIGVIWTAVQAWRAARAAGTAVKQVAAVAGAIAEVRSQTNGMSHRLEALAGQAGVAEGREQMRAEQEGKKP